MSCHNAEYARKTFKNLVSPGCYGLRGSPLLHAKTTSLAKAVTTAYENSYNISSAVLKEL